jgi:bifunctional non-homologous end joining protein LigD
VAEPNAQPAEALAEYRRRRDFTRTAEPAGNEPSPAPQRPIFAVQKHAASRLHYDFRLEMGGVLKSWAIPKGPSLDPADKRLAVMVEDHPLEYAAFEGTIPKGEYGGGTVMLWDFGWWEPDLAWIKAAVDPEAELASGNLKFILHGHKLSGSWALVQMKGRGIENWLLLKHRDKSARSGYDLVGEAPDSVLSGRSLDQIAKG